RPRARREGDLDPRRCRGRCLRARPRIVTQDQGRGRGRPWPEAGGAMRHPRSVSRARRWAVRRPRAVFTEAALDEGPSQTWSAVRTATPAAIAATPTACGRASRSPKTTYAATAATAPNCD